MSDIADIAQIQIERTLRDSLAKRKRFEGISATHCDECGIEIPQRRRELLPGVITCVECQLIAERKF